MDKIVSVVVPTYNMEKYLVRCLDSLIISDIDLIDVIVVNDGSTDSSHDIAMSYAERYPDSIRVIDKPNGHYGTTINTALAEARGKYFRILDADDYFVDGKLQVFVEALKNCDADLVTTNKIEEDIIKHELKQVKAEDVVFGKEYDFASFEILKHSERGEAFNMHTMTYKTSLLREKHLELPGGVCYTDMIYCLVPLDAVKTLMVFDIDLYHYNIGNEGSSTTKACIKRNLDHIVKVMSYMCTYCLSNPIDGSVMQSNRRRYLNEATAIMLDSLLKQRYVSKQSFQKINEVAKQMKSLEVTHRRLNKYYLKHWYKRNRRSVLNASLIVYKLTHPLKIK